MDLGGRLKGTAKRMRAAVLRAGLEEVRSRPLWDGPPPDAHGTAPEDIPTYSLYLPKPDRALGVGVVVFPGGGYCIHAEHEASPVGRWLRRSGIAAMVARYRLAPAYRYPAMLRDGRQAVRLMKEMAGELGLRRVGVLGFSAGGHLAAMTALLTEESEGPSDRADFAILIYPVICMVGPYAHTGCRWALLGSEEESPLAEALSLERRVAQGAPPLFIVHGADDETIDVQNALSLASACREAGVPCELHVFQRGPHGFGLGERGRATRAWPGLCLNWLKSLD